MIDSLLHLLRDVEWLRPLWLLTLLPLPWVIWRLARQPTGAGRWQDIIDAHLLRVLLQQGENGKRSRWPLLAIALAWLLAAVALAGPSFQQQQVQLYQRDSARVYVLDLSPSMNADDVKPSRLARARLKLLDALNTPRDGEQALMVYAGSAHVLTPLATDAKTLAAQVPVLSTDLPPVSGNRPELAFARALQLLRDAGHRNGEIVWITDGIDPDQVERVVAVLQQQPVKLAVLAVGTADGAPVRQANGALLTDKAGKVILARLDLAPLHAVVNAVDGKLATLTADDSDWQSLTFADAVWTGSERQVEGDTRLREDIGAWLVLPLLLIVLLAFRRGSVLPVIVFVIAGASPRSEAGWWQDLWQTPDQQGAALLAKGDSKTAATTFNNPDWRATAQYRAGEFADAAQQFTGTGANAHYNRGNALAKAGKLDEALAAYDAALAQRPDFAEAKANRDAVEKYRQQQNNPSGEPQKSQQQQQQGEAGDSTANPQQQTETEQNTAQSEPSQDSATDQQDASGQQGEPDRSKASPPDKNGAPAQQKPEATANTQTQNKPAQTGNDQQLAAQDDEQAKPANETPLPTALKQLPDDPGGLLRRKMKLEYLRRGQETQQTDQEQRW
ncbi:MAG TPA: VWA domain-containing protein [Permianibacter sp.]|nr:VWA domain-containing protein [Permianibacter sp.]